MSASGDTHDARIAGLATAFCLIVLVGIYLAVAPPAGHVIRQPNILSSYRPGFWYPDLTRPRETLLAMLVLCAPPLCAFGVWSARRAFASLPPPLLGRASSAAACIIAGALFGAAYSGRNVQPSISHDYFGWTVWTGAISTVLAVLYLRISGWSNPNVGRLSRVTGVSVAIVAVTLIATYAALSIYQAPNSIRDRTNIALTFDDLLAPANGTHALGDTMSRYSSLYGEVLAPAIGAGADPVVATFVLVDALTIALFASLFGIFRATGIGTRDALLALAFCFTCTIVATPFVGTIDGQPLLFFLNSFDYPQLIPVRYFTPIVVAAMTLVLCRKPDRKLAFALGASLAVFIVNDATFGLASGFIAIATLVLGRSYRDARLPAISGLFGFAAGAFGVIASSFVLTGSWPNVSSLTAAGRLYTSGATMYPVSQAWNVQLVPFIVFLYTLSYGIARAKKPAAIYFGSLGCAAYFYVLNRPVPSTLQEATFFLTGICLVLLLSEARTAERPFRSSPLILWAFATIAATLSMQSAALWTIPNEFERVTKGFDRPPSLTMENNARSADTRPIETFVAAHRTAGDTMMIDHVNGRILALRLHMRDVSPVVPNLVFRDEADRFIDVMKARHLPPIFATADAEPEILAAMKSLGYVETASVPQIGLFVRRENADRTPR